MNGTRSVHEEEGAQVAVQVVDGCRVGEEEGGSHFRKVVHQLRYGRLNLISEDLASNLDGGSEGVDLVSQSALARIQDYVHQAYLWKEDHHEVENVLVIERASLLNKHGDYIFEECPRLHQHRHVLPVNDLYRGNWKVSNG